MQSVETLRHVSQMYKNWGAPKLVRGSFKTGCSHLWSFLLQDAVEAVLPRGKGNLCKVLSDGHQA